jgi:hypothetical protein
MLHIHPGNAVRKDTRYDAMISSSRFNGDGGLVSTRSGEDVAAVVEEGRHFSKLRGGMMEQLSQLEERTMIEKVENLKHSKEELSLTDETKNSDCGPSSSVFLFETADRLVDLTNLVLPHLIVDSDEITHSTESPPQRRKRISMNECSARLYPSIILVENIVDVDIGSLLLPVPRKNNSVRNLNNYSSGSTSSSHCRVYDEQQQSNRFVHTEQQAEMSRRSSHHHTGVRQGNSRRPSLLVRQDSSRSISSGFSHTNGSGCISNGFSHTNGSGSGSLDYSRVQNNLALNRQQSMIAMQRALSFRRGQQQQLRSVSPSLLVPEYHPDDYHRGRGVRRNLSSDGLSSMGGSSYHSHVSNSYWNDVERPPSVGDMYYNDSLSYSNHDQHQRHYSTERIS